MGIFGAAARPRASHLQQIGATVSGAVQNFDKTRNGWQFLANFGTRFAFAQEPSLDELSATGEISTCHPPSPSLPAKILEVCLLGFRLFRVSVRETSNEQQQPQLKLHREHDPIGCQGMVIRQGEARLIAIVLKPHREECGTPCQVSSIWKQATSYTHTHIWLVYHFILIYRTYLEIVRCEMLEIVHCEMICQWYHWVTIPL